MAQWVSCESGKTWCWVKSGRWAEESQRLKSMVRGVAEQTRRTSGSCLFRYLEVKNKGGNIGEGLVQELFWGESYVFFGAKTSGVRTTDGITGPLWKTRREGGWEKHLGSQRKDGLGLDGMKISITPRFSCQSGAVSGKIVH